MAPIRTPAETGLIVAGLLALATAVSAWPIIALMHNGSRGPFRWIKRAHA